MADSEATESPAINISGGRVIVGNVYGAHCLSIFDDVRENRKKELLDNAQQTDVKDQLVVISTELSMLLLQEFEVVKSGLLAFRKVEMRLEKYAKQINVGRAVFKAAIQSLLSPHFGAEQAQAMIDSEEHQLWADESCLEYLQKTFGAQSEALRDCLELISIDLDAIRQFCRKCYNVKQEKGKDKASTAIQSLRTKVRTTIKTIMAEDDIAEHLQSLRQNTDDFRTLLQQATPKQERLPIQTKPSEQSKLRINRYRRVQEAAANLYHAFGLACTKHTLHMAQLKLQATCNPSQVQFTMLLEQILSNTQPDPLRLTIESSITGTVTNTGIVEALATSSKRLRDDTEDRPITETPIKHRTRKAVGFVDDIFRNRVKPVNHPSETPFPNFCNHSNFCTHVKNLLVTGCPGRSIPLGYLDTHGCSKHLIYLTSHTQTLSIDRPQRFASFRELYARPNRQLSRVQTVKLAKELAVACLQYNATPWFLESSWKADNLNIEQSDQAASFDPYLHVTIHNPNETQTSPLDSCSRTLIRNWTLFSLGLMLMELAYRKPITEMRRPLDLDPGNEYNTDYYTARRLQPSIEMEMGSDYAELVRKCISCDFGHGESLASTRLQEGFYEDVVAKLEDIEERFRAIGL